MLDRGQLEPSDAPPSPLRGESTNLLIQRHLALVEYELLQHPVAGLSYSQRAARAKNIERLREYRLAARFPHNPAPGRDLFFVDPDGVPCALASLILRSGGEGIVRAVVERRNNGRVFDLAADPVLGPALATWLNSAGLTVQEAARIQLPMYCDVDCWGAAPEPAPPTQITPGFAFASAATLGVGVISTVVFAGEQSPWRAVASVASGAAGLAVGASRLDEPGPRRTLGIVDVIVGGVSVALGIQDLFPAKSVSTVANHRVVVQPVAEIAPRGQGQRLGLTVRF